MEVVAPPWIIVGPNHKLGFAVFDGLAILEVAGFSATFLDRLATLLFFLAAFPRFLFYPTAIFLWLSSVKEIGVVDAIVV